MEERLVRFSITELRDRLDGRGETLAAVILDPFRYAGQLGKPDDQLGIVRDLCTRTQTTLVFDLSESGFHFDPVAWERDGHPACDLAIFGPAVGGGLALAACAGRREIMTELHAADVVAAHAPVTPMTLALAAGMATIHAVGDVSFREELSSGVDCLEEQFTLLARAAGRDAVHHRAGSMFQLRLFDGGDGVQLFQRFHTALMDRGVLIAPHPDGTLYVSTAHTADIIRQAGEAMREALTVANA